MILAQPCTPGIGGGGQSQSPLRVASCWASVCVACLPASRGFAVCLGCAVCYGLLLFAALCCSLAHGLPALGLLPLAYRLLAACSLHIRCNLRLCKVPCTKSLSSSAPHAIPANIPPPGPGQCPDSTGLRQDGSRNHTVPGDGEGWNCKGRNHCLSPLSCRPNQHPQRRASVALFSAACSQRQQIWDSRHRAW